MQFQVIYDTLLLYEIPVVEFLACTLCTTFDSGIWIGHKIWKDCLLNKTESSANSSRNRRTELQHFLVNLNLLCVGVCI